MSTDHEPSATRRTQSLRTGGRAARVVERALRATAEELGRSGYSALRVEDVAARSGVNKTTIYRRWPNKAELVAAALRHVAPLPPPPDTGTLRGDLLEALRHSARSMRSPLKRGIIRMLQVERTHPEVDRIVRELRSELRRERTALVERAKTRGELPAKAPSALVVELVFVPVFSRLVTHDEPVDDAFLRGVVDVVLAGVSGGGPRPPSVRRNGR